MDSCCELVRRHVLLTSEQLNVLAVWILHTWAIEAADFTPYLHITAPEKECGKSRVLDVLETVVRKPEKTGGMSAAALMRTVNSDSPTLLLDEVDTTFKGNRDVAEAVRGILNEGFRRGGNIRRCKPPDWEVQTFHVFCPKALAGIGRVPDTIASRSITVEMRRKRKSESVEDFRMRDAKIAAIPLVERLLAWSESEAIETLRGARPEFPDGFKDRQQDVSEPLLAIADFAGSEWPARIRQSLSVILGAEVSEDTSLGVTLLSGIRNIFRTRSGMDSDRILSAELASVLREIEGSPWPDWDNGRGLNANGLAKRLKPYGIHPGTVRISSGTGKGYKREDFTDAWERYLPPAPEEPIPSVTPVTTPVDIVDCSPFKAVTDSHVTEWPIRESPRQSSAVTAVTAAKGEAGQSESKRFVSGVL